MPRPGAPVVTGNARPHIVVRVCIATGCRPVHSVAPSGGVKDVAVAGRPPPFFDGRAPRRSCASQACRARDTIRVVHHPASGLVYMGITQAPNSIQARMRQGSRRRSSFGHDAAQGKAKFVLLASLLHLRGTCWPCGRRILRTIRLPSYNPPSSHVGQAIVDVFHQAAASSMFIVSTMPRERG